MTRAVAGPVSPADGFELAYRGADGAQCRQSLLSGWDVPFERIEPVRSFPSYRGQRNFPGWWWLATTGEHVGYESWLEREQVMVLDANPEVVGVSSQPFWLSWPDGGSARRHAPDYFARLRDGTGVVVDVRADDRIGPKDAEAFGVTEVACRSVGWRYRRVGALDPVFAANLRWLAGYRHSRCRRCEVVDALRQVFRVATGLIEGVQAVGDPVAVLPVAFHLLWCRELQVDLRSSPLGLSSLVQTVGGTS